MVSSEQIAENPNYQLFKKLEQAGSLAQYGIGTYIAIASGTLLHAPTFEALMEKPGVLQSNDSAPTFIAEIAAPTTQYPMRAVVRSKHEFQDSPSK